MKLLTLDTETIGLTGPAIIVQWAVEDEETINIFNFWTNPAIKGLKLIEWFMKHCIVGFNLTFDWFQLQKMYTLLERMILLGLGNEQPRYHISLIGMFEADCRLGSCIKPASACDLMLVARKTTYQITMNRGDIKIRRVPTALAWELAKELEQRIVFKGILFARRKDKYAPRWTVADSVNRTTGEDQPQFKDVVLKFKPSVALKALAIDALGILDQDIVTFSDIEVDKAYMPIENKFAPFATSISTAEKNWRGYVMKGKKRIYGSAWPGMIQHHIDHWEYNQPARNYASRDVDYTRRLYRHFSCPVVGDDDSVLACCVGSVRWRGYAVDLGGIANLAAEARSKIGKYPTAPKRARAYITEVLSEEEILCLKTGGTSKVQLEELAKWGSLTCPFCQNHPREKVDCVACDSRGEYAHPVAERAQNVINTRIAKKEEELYDKLKLAGRFHTSFKVIGALSSRMAGADGLNPQGINHSKKVRKQFTFADGGLILYGGDFDAFEVGLADASYNDPKLRADLRTKAICPGCKGTGLDKGVTCQDCKGEGQAFQKIHALFAMQLSPGISYLDVIMSKGQNPDYYDLGKRGVFSQIYGGDENTLVSKCGVTLEVAHRASVGFGKRYPVMFAKRKEIEERFCSMKQPEGIGKRIYWDEPADYAESLFGFRRYFTLENEICRTLFKLANDLPEGMKKLKIKVKRRPDGSEQFVGGATMSALFGAAFGIQGSNTRAAANHEIQSSGATITKHVQRKIWDIQPIGVSPWLVQPCNIHDEILCPVHPSVADLVKTTVDEAVASFRTRVPLIEMEWKQMKSWAEK